MAYGPPPVVRHSHHERREGMSAQVYWIEGLLKGRLAIMARPRAGDWLEDEISGWAAEHIKTVVSLLEPQEIRELDLVTEGDFCRKRGIEFVSFPVPDRGVPDSTLKATELSQRMAIKIAEGQSIAVHCRAGIGRS